MNFFYLCIINAHLLFTETFLRSITQNGAAKMNQSAGEELYTIFFLASENVINAKGSDFQMQPKNRSEVSLLLLHGNGDNCPWKEAGKRKSGASH